LSPIVRELDERVEKIELGLRDLVSEVLSGEIKQVPEHILQQVNDRIDQAIRKSATIDTDKFETLAGKLEYFDLRHLEQTICNKNLWNKFVNQFSSKQVLIERFDKLASLRNSIRHSRAIDEILHKDGEAALIWFERVLAISN